MDSSAYSRLLLVTLVALFLAATSKADSRILKLKPVEERDEWNVAVGAALFYPFANVQYGLNDKYSVALVPGIFHHKINSLSADFVGSFVSLNGYGDGLYRGVWCQLGVGAFKSSSTYGTFQESQFAFAGLVTIGYRFRLEHLSVGLALGGEYYDLQKSKNIPHSYLLAPISWVDVGWTF